MIHAELREQNKVQATAIQFTVLLKPPYTFAGHRRQLTLTVYRQAFPLG